MTFPDRWDKMKKERKTAEPVTPYARIDDTMGNTAEKDNSLKNNGSVSLSVSGIDSDGLARQLRIDAVENAQGRRPEKWMTEEWSRLS